MRRKNTWRDFCLVLWLVSIILFAKFKELVSADMMYNYGFVAGTVSLTFLRLRDLFGDDK